MCLGVALVMFFGAFLYYDRAINQYTNEQIADAIYLSEGGTKAHTPYGIESVECYSKEDCRRVCLATIRNNRERFKNDKSSRDFISFLSKKYCPYNSKVWEKNVRYFLNKQ